MPYLVLKVDGQETCRQELNKDEPVTIGRGLECTLWLANPKLSRQHCRIAADEGKWVLVDLNSRNGTYVMGQRIEQHVLDDGDTFELDNAQVTFRDGPLVPKRAAAPTAEPSAIPRDLLPESPPQASAESSLFATRAVAQTEPTIRRHMDSTLVGQKPLAFTRPPAQPKVEVESPAPTSHSPPRWFIIVTGVAAALLLIALLWAILS